MQTRNILAILVTIFTAIVAVFAWPASNIEILGQKIDWDGLNLSTITGDKYEGELQFKKALDLQGGKKYTYSADLTQEQEEEPQSEEDGSEEENTHEPSIDYKALAETNATKFAKRLEHYGYQDFELRWYLENETDLKIELLISEKLEEDEQILQLLASKGEVQFWSQDPEYDPEAVSEEETQNFGFYDGMTQLEFEDDQILGIVSQYNQKAGGYGFKVVFANEALVQLLIATQAENYRGTMLVIDGQPIATRSYQIENTEDEDANPVMYMSSLVGDNFAVNDAVEAVFRTGELDNQLNLQLVEDVEPTLGEDYLNNTKLAMILMFGFLSIVLIYRYSWLGIYQVLFLGVNIVWSLAMMKMFGAKLSLALVAGIALGILFNLLINLSFIRRLDVTEKMKNFMKEVRVVRDVYRNLYFSALLVVLVGSTIGIFITDQLFGSFGFLVFVGLVQIYIFTEVFLSQFVYMQNELWKENKTEQK